MIPIIFERKEPQFEEGAFTAKTAYMRKSRRIRATIEELTMNHILPFCVGIVNNI